MTGLLFDAHVELPRVSKLVFDNDQMCPVAFNPSPGECRWTFHLPMI